MRILVTGSRDWLSQDTVWDALGDVMESSHMAPSSIVVVHGDCTSGADRMAQRWAEAVGSKYEVHPADWSAFGKRAGVMRNLQMAKLGADICLAFVRVCVKDSCDVIPLHGSHGTTHCIAAARQEGIPTSVYKEGW